MTVARWWNEFVADTADLVPVPLQIVISLLLAGLVALLWYTFPAWLRIFHPSRNSWRTNRPARRGGRRWRWSWKLRWRIRWRIRWRRRRRDRTRLASADLAGDFVPDIPAAILVLSADELAAAGRYAEAIRERLRAMLRELIERGVIPNRPGWTVTELAHAANAALPAVAGPLGAASAVFSGVWYALLPATPADDVAMRTYAAQLTSVVVNSGVAPNGSADGVAVGSVGPVGSAGSVGSERR
jgi:hypothetical protein